jgi:hypothetical protein
MFILFLCHKHLFLTVFKRNVLENPGLNYYKGANYERQIPQTAPGV